MQIGRRKNEVIFHSVDDFLDFVKRGEKGWRRRVAKLLETQHYKKFYDDRRFIEVCLAVVNDEGCAEKRQRAIEILYNAGIGRTSHLLYDAWDEAIFDVQHRYQTRQARQRNASPVPKLS
jgi:hypothetical protein